MARPGMVGTLKLVWYGYPVQHLTERARRLYEQSIADFCEEVSGAAGPAAEQPDVEIARVSGPCDALGAAGAATCTDFFTEDTRTAQAAVWYAFEVAGHGVAPPLGDVQSGSPLPESHWGDVHLYPSPIGPLRSFSSQNLL